MPSLNLSPFEVDADAEFKFDVRWPKVDFGATTSALLLVDVFRFKSVSSTTCRNNSDEIKETKLHKLLKGYFYVCILYNDSNWYNFWKKCYSKTLWNVQILKNKNRLFLILRFERMVQRAFSCSESESLLKTMSLIPKKMERYFFVQNE